MEAEKSWIFRSGRERRKSIQVQMILGQRMVTLLFRVKENRDWKNGCVGVKCASRAAGQSGEAIIGRKAQ